MIEIVCWNIRWGEGHDGAVDLSRIVNTAMAMGDPDILCFQEVARNFPSLTADSGTDQPAEFRRLLPGFETIFGAGTDVAGDSVGQRRQFGNLVLTRLPVLQTFGHMLPRPAIPETPHAQRQALEVITSTAVGPLRIINTHLEYHSAKHRSAQVERLRALYQEISAHPIPPRVSQDAEDDPYVPPAGPCPTVLCGDFNMEISEPAYERLLEAFDDDVLAFADAWTVVRPREDHPLTCGIYERIYWSSAHCRDFIFITQDLVERARTLDVDQKTDASDHQPLRLVLDLPQL